MKSEDEGLKWHIKRLGQPIDKVGDQVVHMSKDDHYNCSDGSGSHLLKFEQ